MESQEFDKTSDGTHTVETKPSSVMDAIWKACLGIGAILLCLAISALLLIPIWGIAFATSGFNNWIEPMAIFAIYITPVIGFLVGLRCALDIWGWE
jgi:hypothetical protein